MHNSLKFLNLKTWIIERSPENEPDLPAMNESESCHKRHLDNMKPMQITVASFSESKTEASQETPRNLVSTTYYAYFHTADK